MTDLASASDTGHHMVTPGDSAAGSTTQVVSINRCRGDVFDYWRDLTSLAKFMENVVSIEPLGGDRSRWKVRGPGDKVVEWTSVITDLREGELIAWVSEDGADVPNSGRVEFRDAPGGRGTIVAATISYDPPAGFIGRIVAKMFSREPAIQARRDLRRFKQLLETGEISTPVRNLQQLRERETA